MAGRDISGSAQARLWHTFVLGEERKRLIDLHMRDMNILFYGACLGPAATDTLAQSEGSRRWAASRRSREREEAQRPNGDVLRGVGSIAAR